MNNRKYLFYEFSVTLWLTPHLEDDQTFQTQILDKLWYINSKAANLAYGMFDKKKSIQELKQLSSNMIITIMEIENEPCVLTYQYLLTQKVNNIPVLHMGLIMSHKNPHRNIVGSAFLASTFLREKLGDFYITSLASDPSLIGEVARSYTNTWPSPYLDNKRPPNEFYKKVTEACFEEYVTKFFPFPESLKLNTKRFVLESKALEMGFEVDMRKMSRDSDVLVNMFCMFWLNYDRQEIMMQVALCDEATAKRISKSFPIKLIK